MRTDGRMLPHARAQSNQCAIYVQYACCKVPDGAGAVRTDGLTECRQTVQTMCCVACTGKTVHGVRYDGAIRTDGTDGRGWSGAVVQRTVQCVTVHVLHQRVSDSAARRTDGRGARGRYATLRARN